MSMRKELEITCYDCADGDVIDGFFPFAPTIEFVACALMGKDLYCIDRISGRFAGCPKMIERTNEQAKGA